MYGIFSSAEKTKECEKRKQQLIRAAGEVLRYSARTSLSVAVRISKTEFKQNGFERDIAGCSISFCYKKMKPNSSQWRIDRKFEQMGFGRMDEKRLLKKLRNGDEKALEKIIDIYSAYISKIVGSLISSKGTREDIEEVVADTFIALWRTADRINYEKYSSIKAYIAVIARNRTKDWLRNRGQDLQLMDDVLLIDNSLEQLIVQREQQRILADALKQLNPLDCKIFVAYYYQYKKVKEIAHEFEMNPQTVKTRLRRGRAMLKKILIKEGYGNNEN